MKLSLYLKRKKINAGEFAEKIGVADYTLKRYLVGRVPNPQILVAIFQATDGKVQPNDFYNLKVT